MARQATFTGFRTALDAPGGVLGLGFATGKAFALRPGQARRSPHVEPANVT